MKVYIREAILMTANGAVAQLILENHEPYMTLAEIEEGISPVSSQQTQVYHQLRRLDGSKYTGKLTFFLKSTLNSNGIFTKNEYGLYGVDKEAAKEYFEDQEKKIRQNPKLQVRVKNRSISLYTKNSASLRHPHRAKIQPKEKQEELKQDEIKQEKLTPIEQIFKEPQKYQSPQNISPPLQSPIPSKLIEEEKDVKIDRSTKTSEKTVSMKDSKKSQIDTKEQLLNEIEGKYGDRLIGEQKKQLSRVRKILHYKSIFQKLEFLYSKMEESKILSSTRQVKGMFEQLQWDQYPIRQLLKSKALVKDICKNKRDYEVEIGALQTYKFFRPLLKLATHRFFDEERSHKGFQILNKLQRLEIGLEQPEPEKKKKLKPRKVSELSSSKVSKERSRCHQMDSIIEGPFSSKPSPERPKKKQSK